MQIQHFSNPTAVMARTAPAVQDQPPVDQTPSDPVDQPSIDWNSVGKSALTGAAIWGVPATLGAIHPVAGLLGVAGLAAYLVYETGNPRTIAGAAFIGAPSTNVGMHLGALGAVGVAAAGALSLGLSNYLDQRRAMPVDSEPLPATPGDVQGPYYRENAPVRTNLFSEGEQGTAINYAYSVVGTDGEPLEGAMVDIWTADDTGIYDMESAEFRGRARSTTNADGEVGFNAIRPGNYDLGTDPDTGERLFRPAHVHAKVTAPGHEPLLTQLYFPDDPYNGKDPIIDREEGERGFDPVLLQGLEDSTASFHFVLAPQA